MARNGIKSGGKDFKLGHDIKSPGRPKIPEDVKQSMQLNQATIVRIFNDLNGMTPEELKAKAANPLTNVFEHLVIAILKFGIQKGDQNRLAFVLDRVVGKPKETVHHEGDVGFKVVVENYIKK